MRTLALTLLLLSVNVHASLLNQALHDNQFDTPVGDWMIGQNNQAKYGYARSGEYIFLVTCLKGQSECAALFSQQGGCLDGTIANFNITDGNGQQLSASSPCIENQVFGWDTGLGNVDTKNVNFLFNSLDQVDSESKKFLSVVATIPPNDLKYSATFSLIGGKQVIQFVK
ncbi:hypothetical protein D5R81_11490 [Parashewanella spongiae]|uniref:Uncharacterized protein n=1 Tax=Parashewanella spongiae TaxID=342950 RepID=A0A3A6TI08_9GAMM|nr:hypothetical protein [Parashewanella spongiae]MCL1079426.1 hypothetical protein [Parashewanella spongiae]RJY13194.1 hypothetical protein D5R81_11490 [Parashewanella spongiae]